MLSVAASMAWWDLDIGMLRKLAEFFQIPFAKNSGIMDMLYGMTSYVMKLAPDETMDVLERRPSAISSKDYRSMKILAEVDEATKCLNNEDEEVLKKEQQRGKNKESAFTSFVEEWRVRRERVRRDAPDQSQPKQKQRSKKAAARCWTRLRSRSTFRRGRHTSGRVAATVCGMRATSRCRLARAPSSATARVRR